VRSFLALEIPDGIKSYLQRIAGIMARRVDGVRWVRPEGQHITLKFFGEIEEPLAWKMKEALADVEGKFGAIPVTLKKVDAFPSRKRARVIVITLGEGVDNMREIFNHIEDRLSSLGIQREERAYTPHITLGRRKVPVPLLDREAETLEEKGFVVDRLVLFKSTLTGSGAIYAPLWEIRLGEKPPI
jgi:2'-5' RNA ligase